MPDAPEALAETLVRVAAGNAPEGLAASGAADYLGISVSMLRSLDARGLMPAPVQIGDGRCPRFSRSELRAWLLNGAPSRSRWAVMRDAAMKRS